MSCVLVAEKPSVARDLAKFLIGHCSSKNGYYEGNGYKITWCVGHLINLSPPEAYNEKYKTWDITDLPIIPDVYKTHILPKTKDQFNIVKKLLIDKDTDSVICATDPAREGELIFRYVYNASGCKKPVKRLWISSLTEDAIRKGFSELKDSKEYDRLYLSAYARAKADWIVGLNATRLFTVKCGQNLSIGRVQTPTLALIVNRQNEINNFVSETYYQIKGDFGDYVAYWQDHKGNRRITSISEAEAIKLKCQGFTGKVISVNTKEKSIEKPLLFDLTELQKEANKRYGLTAMEVQDIAQSLYEKKITTYPRTDSRYLSDDMVPWVYNVLKSIVTTDCFGLSAYADRILQDGPALDNRVIDNSKISDHHAIIPTHMISHFDFNTLNQNEAKIFSLIAARLLMALSQSHVYDETDVLISVNIELFSTKGKKVSNNGWKEIESALFNKFDDDDKEPAEEEDQTLQNIKLFQEAHLKSAEILKKNTEPKKHYNDRTLLSAMKNASDSVEDEDLKESMKNRGLGTPSTRAAIIERLIDVGYIVRSKKNLIPTEKGISLISIIPDKLKHPEFTAEWEYRLDRISKGEENHDYFMADIGRFISNIVNEYKNSRNDISFASRDMTSPGREVIGECPRCHKNVYEGDKNYYCEGYKDDPKCGFGLFKNHKAFTDRGTTINKAMAKKILKTGKVAVKNLVSKNGNKYDAEFVLNDTGIYVNFDVLLLSKNLPAKK